MDISKRNGNFHTLRAKLAVFYPGALDLDPATYHKSDRLHRRLNVDPKMRPSQRSFNYYTHTHTPDPKSQSCNVIQFHPPSSLQNRQQVKRSNQLIYIYILLYIFAWLSNCALLLHNNVTIHSGTSRISSHSNQFIFNSGLVENN